jgi:hypothetical protein
MNSEEDTIQVFSLTKDGNVIAVFKDRAHAISTLSRMIMLSDRHKIQIITENKNSDYWD